jgi:hypothetical protein
MMIELINDILNNLFDLYQQFFGVPEGVTYALFGSRKRKKALKKVKELGQQGISTPDIPEIESPDLPITEPDPFTARGADVKEQQPTKKITPYKPEFPYRGNQIIIDSGRVLLNSKEDSTFIVGKKAVGISSGGTINLDSDGMCIINAPEIRLGLDASHPLVYGDELANILNQFCVIMTENVVPDMKNAVDSSGVQVTGVGTAAEGLEKALKGLNDGLSRILSKTNFTR